MRSCQSIDPLVTPYIDRELPDSDRQAVDEHLRACPPCHSRVAAEEAVRNLVHATQPALLAHVAPRALHAKCGALAAGLPPSRWSRFGEPRRSSPQLTASGGGKAGAAGGESTNPANVGDAAKPTVMQAVRPASGSPAWTARLAPFAVAASLVTVVGGAFLYQATQRSTRVMAAQLAADHVKCFAMNAALGTRQAPSAVESMMLSSFEWRMHLPPDPSRAGLELVGARPCLYGEGKIAHIMYRHEGRPLSLFMLPDTDRAQELVEVLGHEASVWCVNHRTFVLISREPKQDVERLAAFVQSSLH